MVRPSNEPGDGGEGGGHVGVEEGQPVTASTFDSLPALKPYQPNHSRPVPKATRGMLCGPRSTTLRRPTYSTEASAAMPAMLWTTMPPAKSFTP